MGVSLCPSSPLEERPQAKISPRRVMSRLWLLPAATTAARPFLLVCTHTPGLHMLMLEASAASALAWLV